MYSIMEKKVYKRIYRVKCGDASCFSTRVKDVHAFLDKILVNDASRTLAWIEFEVVSIKR